MQEKLRCTKPRFLRGLHPGVKFFFTQTARQEKLPKTKAVPLNVSSAVIHHNGQQRRYALTAAFQISRLCSSSAPPASNCATRFSVLFAIALISYAGAVISNAPFFA